VAEPLRVLSSPVRVTGGFRLAQLVTLLTADAVVRRIEEAGRAVEWIPAVLAGDLASQLAVEQELAREGLDRAALGRDEFVVRARAVEAAGRVAATELLAGLGAPADLDAGAIDAEASALAATTAFVRLYEAGLVTREERVVDTCPRCATVVDGADAEAGTSAAELYRIRVTTTAGDAMTVDLVCPELLPGVVAVVVPPDHSAAGTDAEVPLSPRAVPVVADETTEVPRFVVPAHDADDLDLARAYGLTPVMVLDAEGAVVADGPLLGLGRYAARAAAADLLNGEGAIAASERVDEAVDRCRRCGTVLVPRLGRHWFLPMGDVEVLAADAVRQGAVAVIPAAVGDELVATAGERGDWCLSQQVWSGQPVPVATCRDCGQVAVSVEPAGSCGKCMGELVPDDDVLDARFVGAVWPLALAGWPRDESGPAAAGPDTLLLVAPTGVVRWALRMVGLGLRLAGAAPFATVLVHPPVAALAYLEVVDDTDPDAVRAAIAGLDVDLDETAEAAATVLIG
jgi:valyl-tRNA synthetase